MVRRINIPKEWRLLKLEKFLENLQNRDEGWRHYPMNKNYLVSNQGHVLALPTRRLLRAEFDVALRAWFPDGGTTQYPVGLVVARTWLLPVEGKKFVIHLDKDRTNNFVNNLRWATEEEHGKWWFGEAWTKRKRKMSEETKVKIRKGMVGGRHPMVKGYMVIEGMLFLTTKRAAEHFGMHAMQVWRRVQDERWLEWKYVEFIDRDDKRKFVIALEGQQDMSEWMERAAGYVGPKIPDVNMEEVPVGHSYLIEGKVYYNFSEIQAVYGTEFKEIGDRLDDPAWPHWLSVSKTRDQILEERHRVADHGEHARYPVSEEGAFRPTTVADMGPTPSLEEALKFAESGMQEVHERLAPAEEEALDGVRLANPFVEMPEVLDTEPLDSADMQASEPPIDEQDDGSASEDTNQGGSGSPLEWL